MINHNYEGAKKEQKEIKDDIVSNLFYLGIGDIVFIFPFPDKVLFNRRTGEKRFFNLPEYGFIEDINTILFDTAGGRAGSTTYQHQDNQDKDAGITPIEVGNG